MRSTPGGDTADGTLRTVVLDVAGLNLAYFGVEFSVAIANGSVSLFADSIDFLEDASVNLLIFVAFAWSVAARSRLGVVLAFLLLVPGMATLWTAVGLHTHYHFLHTLAALGAASVLLAIAHPRYRSALRPILLAFVTAGFAIFLLAGDSIVGLWIGIAVMGLFSFAESPQLQALLADIAPPSTRDASYALYFTLAFGVGSLWTAVYGLLIDALGESTGVPLVFVLMGVAFILAALTTLPIRTERETVDGEPMAVAG